MEEVKKTIGDSWNYVMVPSIGLSGGIIVLWNIALADFVVRDLSSQCIIGDLSIFNNGKWRVAAIYGNKDLYKRRELWNKLEVHSNEETPMVIGGDFNCLNSSEDKRGGRKFHFSKGPKEMEAFITNNDYQHLARIASDHSPIVLNFLEHKSSKSKCLKFEDVWTSYPAALSVVKNEWKKSYSGSNAQILNYKFKRVLKALFFWSKAKLKNLNLLKENLLEQIMDLQNKESNNGWLSKEEYWTLKTKIFELNSTMDRLDSLWKQRAKAKWLKEGDTNSKFYHAFASARRSLNKIVKIKNDDGVVIEEPNQIEEVIISFLKNKWRQRNSSLEGWPHPKAILNDREKAWLTRYFSVTKFEVVLKQLGANVAPACDGITYSFIK
ncbi:uncharacterized protein LOC110116497 [Dendrobium catenatum]|uniref:uncharacterized protein LOC110116497 n=1 Tax=Dendrobium catenatum TaxID=906689 RepID=UPI0010A00FD4|nr:uncharacterized protein LOC110116497 [Dendrobium catenatum]